jgi:phosphatidylglycerophosphatase A
MSVATMDRAALLLAQGFGVGRIPRAPGTFGTLLAVPLYLAIVPLGWVGYAAVLAVLFAAGVWLCGVAGQALRAGDHPSIVWDEIVGFLATMLAAPAGGWWVVAGFALFRLFDIWKPFPIRQIERRVGGGLGVMLDDLLAAVYAWVVLKLVVVSGVL